ncbi:MAG: radical SAM protein [Clostridia bacterium]|nr:radical SAM protein [Clostridia bacterium]
MAYVSDYLHKKASAKKVPLTGNFELSPVCNFACKMCYVRRTPEQIAAMGKSLIPWEKWLDLGRAARDAGMLYLLLTGGEPFIYPGFRQLYTELHKLGLLIFINSNGTMIDEATVAWLKEYAPVRVNITLYGASPETYRRICGRADGYDRAMRAIRLLREAGINVVINASMIPENACDLEAIIETGRSLGLNTRVSTYMFPPMRREAESGDSRFTPEQSAEMYLRKNRCQLSPEKYCEFLSNSIEKVKNSAAAPENDDWGTDNAEFMRCRAGRCTFWVNWEGNMNACGMMDFPLCVHPFEEPFADCWMRLTNAVRSTPVLKGCEGCDKREICNPCVAMIYGETGTVDQKAPYMCRLAGHTLELMRQQLEDEKK